VSGRESECTKMDALVADVRCIPKICINDPANRYNPSSAPAFISFIFISSVELLLFILVLDSTRKEMMNENRLNSTGGGAAFGSILLYKPFTIGV